MTDNAVDRVVNLLHEALADEAAQADEQTGQLDPADRVQLLKSMISEDAEPEDAVASWIARAIHV
ncbi:MAG: hypothetical protein ACLFWH_06440 [Actinomycetota bacterium]